MQAQSFCIDADIKVIAGDAPAAAVSYLHAHSVNPIVTKQHVENLTEEQKKEIVNILQEWTKRTAATATPNSKLNIAATPDQVWEFVFCLDPEALKRCFAGIEPLLQQQRYQQVVDSCTAILKQYPVDTAAILLQRGLARALLGGQDKEAVSDYLRAFLKDKDATIEIVNTKQKDHLKSVKNLMQNCVYSKCPSNNDTKAYKQWLALTIDCCRFLLTFEPDNFRLQMTFVERLKSMHKTDRAITMLSETLDVLLLETRSKPDKITEVLLRRANCHLGKQQLEQALNDIITGLNAEADCERTIENNNQLNYENEYEWLLISRDKTIDIAKELFGGKKGDLNDLQVILDKAATKLSAEDRFKTVTKMENVRSSIDLYRAILVIQSSNKDVWFKLAGAYAKLGKSKLAVKIFDKLLEDPHFHQHEIVLTARASCYRELGNKEEAHKDYDTLLRSNPRDVSLLCERALIHAEDDNIPACIDDVVAACKINQKAVVNHISKEPLVQRTRLRQILFDRAKFLLQDAPIPSPAGYRTPHSDKGDSVISDFDMSSIILGISLLLTKLNPSDLSCHILLAHAMFHAGSINDAEAKLKKMLNEHTQALDVHIIKLHLGLMKIFTKRRDEGMAIMIDVLTTKSDRVVSSLLRDIPISERAQLSDEAHQFGIDLLQNNRQQETVKQAVHCFTLGILSCRGTDLVLEESTSKPWLLLNEAKCLTGIRKKSDKMTNSSWSLAAVSTSSISLKSNFRFHPNKFFHLGSLKRRRLNGGTGVFRSYLARAECMAHLGDHRAAILDFSAAIEVNNHCVEGFCGRAFMRLALGDETECVNDVTIACDLDIPTVVAHIHALPDEAKRMLLFWIDHRVVVLLLNYGYKSSERLDTGASASTISMLDETTFKPGEDVSRRSSLSSIHPPTPPFNVTTSNASIDDVTPEQDDITTDETTKKLHKSKTSSNELQEALLSLDSSYNTEPAHRHHHHHHQNSGGSTSTTVTSLSTYDDVISGMEKSEILLKSLLLGKLLITVDPGSSTWHGMYADILIVKGDYDEALRHLQTVLDLTPNDVTATARAGLINIKINRYKTACHLLSGLTNVDHSGLVYVLKAIDSSRRRRLAEEAYNSGETLSEMGKFAEARDFYSLSLLGDSYLRVEKLRLRSRCQKKIGETSKAIIDISEVIKEMARRPQASDYCARASLYLIEGKEFQCCRDYMKALDIDRMQAVTLIHVNPGRGMLSSVFYRQALTAYSRRNYQECADMCDSALHVDEGNIDTRKLRARAKREISKCIVQ